MAAPEGRSTRATAARELHGGGGAWWARGLASNSKTPFRERTASAGSGGVETWAQGAAGGVVAMQNDGCHLSRSVGDVRLLSSSIPAGRAGRACLSARKSQPARRRGRETLRPRAPARGVIAQQTAQHARQSSHRATTYRRWPPAGAPGAHEGELMTNMATQVREGPASAPGASARCQARARRPAGVQASLGVWSRDAARRYCSVEGVVTTAEVSLPPAQPRLEQRRQQRSRRKLCPRRLARDWPAPRGSTPPGPRATGTDSKAPAAGNEPSRAARRRPAFRAATIGRPAFLARTRPLSPLRLRLKLAARTTSS